MIQKIRYRTKDTELKGFRQRDRETERERERERDVIENNKTKERFINGWSIFCRQTSAFTMMNHKAGLYIKKQKKTTY